MSNLFSRSSTSTVAAASATHSQYSGSQPFPRMSALRDLPITPGVSGTF